MRYLGGKFRIGPRIAEFLNSKRERAQSYIEPFCGGLWVTYLIEGERFASDSNKAVITLYKAMQDGWVPPNTVTRDEYAYYRLTKDLDDPMTAFVGIGCSFGGKWFGGYAGTDKRSVKERSYAANAQGSLLKKIAKCKEVVFSHQDYKEAVLSAPSGSLIYMDPPYAGTTGYKVKFDNADFWNFVREQSYNHEIYVSEFKAPDDFISVLDIKGKTEIRDKKGERADKVERLFTLVK